MPREKLSTLYPLLARDQGWAVRRVRTGRRPSGGGGAPAQPRCIDSHLGGQSPPLRPRCSATVHMLQKIACTGHGSLHAAQSVSHGAQSMSPDVQEEPARALAKPPEPFFGAVAAVEPEPVTTSDDLHDADEAAVVAPSHHELVRASPHPLILTLPHEDSRATIDRHDIVLSATRAGGCTCPNRSTQGAVSSGRVDHSPLPQVS